MLGLRRLALRAVLAPRSGGEGCARRVVLVGLIDGKRRSVLHDRRHPARRDAARRCRTSRQARASAVTRRGVSIAGARAAFAQSRSGATAGRLLRLHRCRGVLGADSVYKILSEHARVNESAFSTLEFEDNNLRHSAAPREEFNHMALSARPPLEVAVVAGARDFHRVRNRRFAAGARSATLRPVTRPGAGRPRSRSDR